MKAPLTSMAQVRVSESGMREASLEAVRAGHGAERPIVIEVYPDTGPVLADGRHRFAVAKERGETGISATVRTYDRAGNVKSERSARLRIGA